jgi:hypothetical protein
MSNAWGVGGEGVYGVVGTGTVRGVTGSGPEGVGGYASGANSRGVYGQGDYGVYGLGNHNSASWGVYGAGGAQGVVGLGTNFGVRGSGGSEGVRGVGPRGVVGIGSGGGEQGVYGNGAYGVVALGVTSGVQGEATGNGGTGVFGIKGAGASSYGGFFRGNVGTTGTYFSNVPAAAQIDHPQDPANRYLTHASVHAPEMLNVYGGAVVLDAKGRATVRLPRYYHALNTEGRVQLTAVGAPAPDLHVAQEIEDGRFRIAGGGAGQKVYWQVTGVRHDAEARRQPLRVEALKPRGDRGKYLSPELFGKGKRDRIGPVAAKASLRDRNVSQPGSPAGGRGPALTEVPRRP